MRVRENSKKRDIEQVGYQPARPYAYDIEIFTMADMRCRSGKRLLSKSFRYEFYMMILISGGHCSQFVDFQSVCCSSGTILILRPGQAHNFGLDLEWDGLIVLMRPEFLHYNFKYMSNNALVNIDSLPSKIEITKEQFNLIYKIACQIKKDSLLDFEIDVVNSLLCIQAQHIIARINAYCSSIDHFKAINASNSLFDRFKNLVEEKFATMHSVCEYARALGCSEKSLTRASLLVTKKGAKEYIRSRIMLEAKRLLAHTDFGITIISERLGFAEATHFCKFFKAAESCSPGHFRAQQVCF